MQKTIPNNPPPADEPAEDTVFIDEQLKIWYQRGVQFYFSRDFGAGPGIFSSFAFLNGSSYCSTYAYARREALEMCIATIVVGQLQGLVIEPPPSLTIKSGAF